MSPRLHHRRATLRIGACGAPLAALVLGFFAANRAFADTTQNAAPRCPAPSGYTRDSAAQAAAASTIPVSPGAPSDDTIRIESDDAQLGVEGDASLRGNVRVVQGDRQISADAVEYSAKDSSFKVQGKVEYRDPIMIVRGASGEFGQASGAEFSGAEFELPERPARGKAESMSVSPQGVVELNKVDFSTCPADDPAWKLSAANLRLDTAARSGTGRGASIEFKGVPILYLPFMSFPLGSQRKTGFLFPDLGASSRSGAQLTAPWYWNIHPQLDLTAEPTAYARRGLDLAGEMRFLTSRQRGTLRFNMLPSDRLADRDRSRVTLQHQSLLPAGWRSDIEFENVSDDEYFEDFAQGPEGTSVAFTERRAQLSYRDDHWWILGQAQHFQTIDRELARVDRPYARLPRVVASGDYRFGALALGLDSELVYFDRNVGTTGWRLDLAPRIGLDWSGPGYFVRPSVAYRHTQYELDTLAVGANRTPSRSLPQAALDAGLILERDLAGSRPRRLTLEPRAYYLYTPYRRQDDLPLFDTALPDLTLNQLLASNRYVGADRVGDANQLSTAVSARIYDSDTGRRRLSATLGQTWYFEVPRVTLPGEARRTDKRSDFIAELSIETWRDFRVDAALQWNPQASRTERSQLRLQYRPAPDRVINLGYRSQFNPLDPISLASNRSPRLDQAEASIAWPVSRSWQVFARTVYDLGASTALEQFLGLEYRACCWRLRTVARRFISNRTGERDSGIYLQLELNGLASVGTPAGAFLEDAIRGYSAAAPSELRQNNITN